MSGPENYIGVGERIIEGATSIPIQDENGDCIDVALEDFWEHAPDAQSGAIDWETYKQIHGADELERSE